MKNQKSMHLKLNYESVAWLEKWAFTDGRPKNAIINDAVKAWITCREKAARAAMYGKRAEFCEHLNEAGINPDLIYGSR